MKKLLTILFFIPLFCFSQCNINKFDLNLMHKDLDFAENFIFSDLYSTNYKKNLGLKNYKPKTSLDYLEIEHDADVINFTYKNNYLKRESEYTLKTIDRVIYKIEIEIFYTKDELKEFENDYTKIKKCLTNIYKIKTATGEIRNNFREHKDSDLINKVTGSYESYEKKLIYKNNIQKVNDLEIGKKKEYYLNNGGVSGFSNDLRGFSILISFTNLNGTILDNRGY